MSKPSKNSDNKSRRKWPWIILLCLVALVGLARLSLMTGPVHRWVKNMIVDTANNQLNPTLSIGGLSGDLWNSATLTDIVLSDEDSTVASIDTVRVEYSPLSYFSDVFQIHKVRLVRPFIKIKQHQDSAYNVQSWVAVTDTAAADTSAAFAFSISNLSVEHGRVDASIAQLEADPEFQVDELNLAAALDYFGEQYKATIADFNFDIKNTRLDAPISLSAAADASESSVTLEKLAIATGHSMLQASGRANLADSVLNFQANANPVGWKDLAAYMDSMPVQKDINMSLTAKGNMSDFELSLDANAQGIDHLALSANFQRDSTFYLSSFQASASRLDLEAFMSDTAMPRLQNLDFRARGRMPLDDYQQGQLEGTLSAENLRQGPYRLDALQGTLTLNQGNAKIRIEPINRGQRLIVNTNLSRIWSEQPSVFVGFQGDEINPAEWLQDQAYAGTVTFNGEVSGTGWFPEQNSWNYQLTVSNTNMMEQQVDRATFSGRFSSHMLTNQSDVLIGDSELHLQAEVHALQTLPDFSYTLQVKKLNFTDFTGLQQYPSSVTGVLKGSGRGSSLQNLQMQTSVQADSAIFKGEFIGNLSLTFNLADSLLTVQKGELSSTIADAGFEGQIHLSDFYSPDNKLDLDIQLKDISTFASIANVEILQTSGQIEGELKPTGQDSLVFDGMVDLRDVNYNSQFIANRVSGGIRVDVTEQPRYLFDFTIDEPIVSSVNLQNIGLKTEGQLTDAVTSGSFEISLVSAPNERIDNDGTYRVTDDSTSVKLTSFDLTSSLRTLSLQRPFHASLVGGVLQTDTLRISSKDQSAFMELAVPYADTLHQQGYFKADNLNLAVIQDAILNETYFEGILFGEVHVDRADTGINGSADVMMSQLVYRETKLDTLRLKTNIHNERLTGMMKLYQDSLLIAEGEADIPFTIKNPDQLEEAFFAQPVSGKLTMHALELSRFSTLLEQMGYDNTDGIVQFDGTLNGQAGRPRLNATLSLKQAQLSGVPIDSLTASVNYQPESSNLNLSATLTSLQQQAMEVEARMPLDVDMRSLGVGLPGPQDSISVDIATNQFNLKALNDFLNRDMARNLEGRLDGNVRIRGPRSDLQTSGQITLRRGAVRVVRAGIRLDHIESTLQFEPDKIVLANMRMESGNGRLTAQGELAMEQLVPGDIDITINAKNFKAANTDQYNALVNLGLNVEGSVTKPNITGNLEVINGFIELDNFGEKSVEQVSLDTTLAPETETSLYDSLSLDMDIEFNRRFFVRNQRYLEMEIELEGQLDILKETNQDLRLFGTLNTARGYARPLGKRFELEEGSLAFAGPPDNPQVNIRTLYEPPQAEQEVQIWYIIEGTVEDPQFKYESQPPMDLAGIISYTLFGQPFYKLNPAEQSVASSSSNNAAADFAMEVLLDRLESIATRRLGIDVVRIENTRIGGDSGTSVTTGWYINPKVFFAIQNVITGSAPTTGFYLEYYLQQNLKLILSQGNDNRQGVDLLWEYDY